MENNPVEDFGGSGGLLGNTRYLRSDCRLVARILSNGVVPEDLAKSLLSQAYRLAAEAAQAGRTRDYRAAMSIILAASKLEQDAFLRREEQHNHVHLHDGPADSPRVDLRSIVARIAELNGEGESQPAIEHANGNGQT